MVHKGEAKKKKKKSLVLSVREYSYEVTSPLFSIYDNIHRMPLIHFGFLYLCSLVEKFFK